MEPLRHARAFATWIDERCHADPGVRSALRRGVRKGVDEVPFMHKYIANWLTSERLQDLDTQRAYYTVAALIAAQRRDQYAAAGSIERTQDEEATADSAAPQQRLYGASLGTAFAAAVARGPEAGIRESSAETRLNLLTRQSIDGLHRHLPGAVRQLRDKQTDVDWAQLLVDLSTWRRYSGRTKRRWLQDFYRARGTVDYDKDLTVEQADRAAE
ncbi:type I-E CRISPR-associated protein Cse2/CasB [Kitasatospora acidiphila]|uniref:type I-E CRISPR-associated protein Cse2/CasB n=1 Tax=Kitasatospora acidiphila TaxID=2567942 RepID=UPI003C73654F